MKAKKNSKLNLLIWLAIIYIVIQLVFIVPMLIANLLVWFPPVSLQSPSAEESSPIINNMHKI